MKRVPMTPRGYELLVEELKHLREVLRPQNVLAIEEARAHGDISENAEFDAAKDRQAHIDGRMRELEGRIGMAEVIDVASLEPADRVIFGATVHLLDLDTEAVQIYRIVGEEETDARRGLISHSSPIGRAIISRSTGDEVKVATPRGTREFEILKVEYV